MLTEQERQTPEVVRLDAMCTSSKSSDSFEFEVDMYKIVDLYRDADLVFVGAGDRRFLGWGPSFGEDRINPLVLIEVTYLLFDLYKRVLHDCQKDIKSILCRIELHGLYSSRGKTTLAPYGINANSHVSAFDQHTAPDSQLTREIEIQRDHYDPSELTYRLLREVYRWFGIQDDKIPYLTEDKSSIDVEKLKDPKKH